MLRRVITKSLLRRKRHLAGASLAILLAATLVAALSTLSLGMKSQVSRELEAYGANILVMPQAMSLPAGTGYLAFGEVTAEKYIDEENLSLLETAQVEGVKNYAPYLYAVASYQGQKVVLVGTLFDKLRGLASYWQVEGGWVNDGDGNGSIIGKNVARKFALHPGDQLSLDLGGTFQSFEVSGIADVGGSEDNQIFIALKTAQTLANRLGQVDLIQIRASTEKRSLSEIAEELKGSLSGVDIKVVGQIAGTEQRVLLKIELLMVLITVLVLLVSGVAVFSTLTASVLERTKEIGLMKALGARNNWIALIFLAEGWSLGLVGGLLGNVFGWGLAQAIAQSVFGSHLSPQILTIPITLATALAIATLAALGPVRNTMSVDPIVTLRGE